MVDLEAALYIPWSRIFTKGRSMAYSVSPLYFIGFPVK